MRSNRTQFGVACLLLGTTTAPLPAQVFSSEFFSDPASEGWDLLGRYCEPQTWNAEGWYYQRLSLDACPPGPGGGDDAYQRSLQALNGTARFFLEFRLQTDGERSEIPYGAPTVVALANSYGVVYHITVAQDQIKFARDVDEPIWFIDIEPGVPHTYRVDLYPDRYAFYIDAYLSDEGLPDGPFPARDSRIAWEGDSWYLPCDNAWDYIRYGVIPADGSGDYDSDGVASLSDFYFFHECLSNQRFGINGGPDQDAGPGCRFADFDFDADTDLADFAEFQHALELSP